jgi:hypothetical protein
VARVLPGGRRRGSGTAWAGLHRPLAPS